MAGDKIVDDEIIKRMRRGMLCMLPVYLLIPLIIGLLFPSGKQSDGLDIIDICVFATGCMSLSITMLGGQIISSKKRLKFFTLFYLAVVLCLFAGTVLLRVVRGYEIPWAKLLDFYALMTPAMYILLLIMLWIFGGAMREEKILEEKSRSMPNLLKEQERNEKTKSGE